MSARSVIRRVAAAPIAVLLLVLFSSQASRHDVAAALAQVSSGWALLLAVLAVGNLLTYWLVLMAVLPGLSLGGAARVQLASTAMANTLPAGGALGTGYTVRRLQRAGFELEQVLGAMVATGVAATAAKLATPLLALMVAAVAGSAAGPPVDSVAVVAGVACAGGLVLAALARRRERLLAGASRRLDQARSRLARLLGRPSPPAWAPRALRSYRRAEAFVRPRWRLLVAATVLSHTALFVLFLAALRAAGIDAGTVPASEALAVFAVARVVALVPLTPGGVGLIEVALGASLGIAGADPSLAVVSVAMYRAATYLLPTLLGLGMLTAHLIRLPERAAGPIRGGLAGIPRPPDPAVPLVVDLDGTLFPLTTRTLMQSRLAARSPAAAWAQWRAARRDRLGSKLALWEQVGLDVATVPVRRELLDWVAAERARGREVVVASGAPQGLVDDVLRHYPVFDHGFGSTPDCLLVGPSKAALLTARYGPGCYDYVGDSAEDLPVWETARLALLCAPRRSVARRAGRLGGVVVLPRRRLPVVAAALGWLRDRRRPGLATHIEFSES